MIPSAPDTVPDTDPVPSHRRPRYWIGATFAVSLALFGGVAVCESMGWPFLAKPAERWLSARLDRPVSFADSSRTSLRLKLLGGIRVTAGRLEVGNPSWAGSEPMLLATDTTLHLRWRDLLGFGGGQPLHIERLTADTLALVLQRRADGSASWQLGQPAAAGAAPKFDGVRFDQLAVREGSAKIDDAVLALQADTRFSLVDGDGDSASPAAVVAAGQPRRGLQARAEGRMGGQPLLLTLRTGEPLQALGASGAAPAALPTQLRVQVGGARLAFDGSVSDLFGGLGLQGVYKASGPSLAAMGAPLKLTLPTTREFSIQGKLAREGTRWFTAVQTASIGRSRLAGEFTFDTPPGAVPTLAGRLRGSVLWLEDLGPAVGVPTDEDKPTSSKPGRVLPDRNFDLPSLRAMNANVLVVLDRLESGSSRLQAVKPLSAHIALSDGVLNIQDIDAKLAQGRIRGQLQLDGRAAVARWNTQLTGAGLQIEQWILQPRTDKDGKSLPPYATGRLGARVELAGQGRSTAELLGSADGRAVLHWTRGTLSHLVVEAAGIDIAQALGVLIRGDSALPVTCGAADLRVVKGVVKPEVMLVDTRDSTIWLDGTVSLATEQMQMVARVAPKDFSPLTLRTPLHIDGTLSEPSLSLEKGPLMRRLVPAALLAALNPLAAVLPLLDLGDDEAKQAISSCQSVVARRGG